MYSLTAPPDVWLFHGQHIAALLLSLSPSASLLPRQTHLNVFWDSPDTPSNDISAELGSTNKTQYYINQKVWGYRSWVFELTVASMSENNDSQTYLLYRELRAEGIYIYLYYRKEEVNNLISSWNLWNAFSNFTCWKLTWTESISSAATFNFFLLKFWTQRSL